MLGYSVKTVKLYVPTEEAGRWRVFYPTEQRLEKTLKTHIEQLFGSSIYSVDV